ncbi:hypothetical protein M3Y97_00611700 [Aphelenchoides bicaudatus]|nr:hypothetical protein M3Y97_00611700 [Aphelenchoides bicaudatus]
MVVNVLILFVVCIYFYNYHYKRQLLPPGPAPIPVLGNLLSLIDAKQHIRTLLKWREQFGNVYTIWIGEEPIVTVNDAETAERWFVQEGNSFCDRYMNEYVLQKGRNNAGILSTNGLLWKEHRRFALKSFRECLGQSGIQERIMTEVDCLIDKLHKDNSQEGLVEHDFCRLLELSASSVIGSVVFGQRFTVDNREAEFDELKQLSNKLMEIVCDPVKLGLINNEFTRKIPFLKHLSADLIAVFNDINRVIDCKIDECTKKMTPDKLSVGCYVEAFLREQVELDLNKKAHTYNRLQLRANCLDLFIAGQETTAASLQWAIAYLVLDPDVQQKVHEELDRVVGRSQKVYTSHRLELPYTQAVVVESQRCANILLQNLIRRTTRDITIDGFYLKKGQAVIPQISTMLYDPILFPNPEVFNPERFFENGKLANTEKVLPFSLGKRQCIGEQIARAELFLFVANILSQFKLLPATNQPKLERQNNGTASTILPYKVRIEPHGPMPFPVFGNLPQLMWNGSWERQFAKWAKEFNGLYTYWFGTLPVTMIGDYETAYEVVVKNSDSCSNRGDNRHFNQMCREGTFGLVLTSGDLWKEQRNFLVRVMREFGMGTNVMQSKVLLEVEQVIELLERDIQSGVKEIDVAHYTELGLGSVIHSVLFGYRFDAENRAEFDMLKNLTFNMVALASDPFVGAAIMNETVSKLPIFKRRLQRFANMFHELNHFVDENIEKHQKVLDDTKEPTNFIEAYLIEKERQEANGKQHYFSQKQLRSVLIDSWFAGQETSASTLSWPIPEVQQKVHDELDQAIGENRIVKMNERHLLPYLNAVILESQRCGNVVVQNVLRLITRDIHLKDGRILRKGTYICPQISAMLYDEKRFPEPEKFRVERFLNEDGSLKKADDMVAFSLGRRRCPGEGLAQMELFLFTSNILNKFRLQAGQNPIRLERDGGGIATNVKPFKCQVIPRF